MKPKEIVIEFDGGTSNNIPSRGGFGYGYGSYKIGDEDIKRVEFGLGHSCNSAEIRTLTAALTDLADRGNSHLISVLARGDSMIALSWCKDGKKLSKKSKKTATNNFIEAIQLLKEQVGRFQSVRTEWRSREHSVKLFGH